MVYTSTTTTSGTNVTNAEPNYHEYCWYRLPCGICTRTNSMCPLGKAEISWEVTCDPSVTYSKNKDDDWFVNLIKDIK